MINRVLALIFISCTLLFSQNQSDYSKLIYTADNLAYNFQFDSSRVLIQNAIATSPDRPEAYELLSKIHLWYALGSKDQNMADSFFVYSDSTIDRCDKLIDRNGDEKDILYILGNIYKYRAMVYGTIGSTLDAFWATKKSVSFFEDVIDIDSNYYSAYGGIGIFEYALSYVPAMFNWALTISGLAANKNNGFNLIKKAATKASKDNIEYKFHYTKLLDEHYAEYSKSIEILTGLTNKYPENSLFHYQLAIEYIKSRDLEKADSELDIVIKKNHPKFSLTNSFSLFLKGDIYFRNNKWEKALKYYQQFIQKTNSIDYTGIASFRSAYCNFFLNNQNEFRKLLILSSNGNPDIEDDSYANEMSDIIIENGMDEERKLLIKIENAYFRGDDSFVINNSGSIDSLINPDMKAEAYIYLSDALIKKNKLADAKIAARKSKAIKVTNSLWTKPMSMYNLALIDYKEKKYGSARQLVTISENINDYRNKNLIQSYINNLKSKLKSSIL